MKCVHVQMLPCAPPTFGLSVRVTAAAACMICMCVMRPAATPCCCAVLLRLRLLLLILLLLLLLHACHDLACQAQHYCMQAASLTLG